jgi:hypothetical protein
MRKMIVCSALFGSLLALHPAGAQQPAPPAAPAAPPAAAPKAAAPAGAPKPLKVIPSPAAKVSQQVGTAEVSIEYSSPGVKKRKIWGELVPYDKMWRTGANASNKLTLTKDMTIGGKPVPAGTYNLLTIPGKKSWTIFINKDTTLNANVEKHSDALDVAKFTVTPKAIPFRERLAFIFSDVTDDSVNLDLEWEKVRVSIPIKAGANS